MPHVKKHTTAPVAFVPPPWELGKPELQAKFDVGVSLIISGHTPDGREIVIGEVWKTTADIVNIRDDERAMLHGRILANAPNLYLVCRKLTAFAQAAAKLTDNQGAIDLAREGAAELAKIERPAKPA